MVKFYLGLHQPADAEKIRLPVFMSVSRLAKRRTKLNHDDWIMDSGGFTAISTHGKYIMTPSEYLSCINRHDPKFAFCQDWMCEPHILEKTGMSISEHQRLTTKSYIQLSMIDSRVRPVIQGWNVNDYVNHVDLYRFWGVDMCQEFGVGTICSRNGSSETVLTILSAIKRAAPNAKLHGFGVKSDTLVQASHLLTSADSMAWSSRARRLKLCAPACSVSCANCLEAALLWRKYMLHKLKENS